MHHPVVAMSTLPSKEHIPVLWRTAARVINESEQQKGLQSSTFSQW